MLNSVPIVLQAAAWPLIGAAIILALGRVLPRWLRRLIALAAALASLLTLRSIAGGPARGFALAWDPITLFRMGPALESHSLSLLSGMVLAGLTAAAALALGANERDGQRTPWHGLLLVALSGCLIMALAANLLALALGSGLLTLAVAALAVWHPGPPTDHSWPPLALALPGLAATLLLVLAGLQMDVRLGHASLLARTQDQAALGLVAAAGLLWVLTYLVKATDRPESAAALLLPAGAGLYLLAREVLISTPGGQPWLPAVGMALLLAGSLLAWLNGPWPGLAVQQLGLAVASIWLLGGARQTAFVPWPSVSLTLALGILAFWWGSEGDTVPPARSLSWRLPEPLSSRVEPRWVRLRAWVQARTAFLSRWRGSWAARHVGALGPAVALASVAGLPLTAGAVGRWQFYGRVLYRGEALLLFLALAADVLLSAAMWAALWTAIQAAGRRRVRPAGLVAMIALAAPLLVWGLAPGVLARSVGLNPPEAPGVSAWGLGLLFAMPWLAGGWLAYTTSRAAGRLEGLRQLARSDLPYRAAAWLGRQLVAGFYWLGQVGEGEGWWGWAIILLALGAMFLTVR